MSNALGISVTHPTVGLPTQKFLTQSGDGLGSHDVLGNYATPTDFYYLSTGNYDIHSILLSVSDNSSFNQADYGAIPGGLTTGLKFIYYSYSSNTEWPLLSGVAFKRNYEWFEVTATAVLTTFAGTAQTLRIVFDMGNDYGQPFRLSKGDKFIIRVQDDFTTLTGHTFGLRGIKY